MWYNTDHFPIPPSFPHRQRPNRPGPATNAECFVGKPIESYVGIEPNTYFHPIFRNKTVPLDLAFPIELLPLEGESLGLPDESVDQVIITHVLCSVRDVTQVLSEVNRVLKPGGKIFLVSRLLSVLLYGCRRAIPPRVLSIHGY